MIQQYNSLHFEKRVKLVKYNLNNKQTVSVKNKFKVNLISVY